MITTILFLTYIIYYNKSADLKVIFCCGILLLLFYALIHLILKKGRNLGKGEIKKFEIEYTISSFIIYSVISFIFFYLHNINLINFSYEFNYKTIILGIFLVFLHDIYFYFIHYLLHFKFFYKNIHLIHHKSKETNLMSAYSFHPIEAIMYVFVLGILFIFDLNIWAFLFAVFCNDMITIIGHTGKEIFGEKYKKSFFFKHFVNSTYHFDHHLKNKGNLAGYSSYLDKFMGTYNKDYEKNFENIKR